MSDCNPHLRHLLARGGHYYSQNPNIQDPTQMVHTL